VNRSGVAKPLGRLPGSQALGHRRVRHAQYGARPVEVRGSHDHAAQLAALHFVHEHRGDTRSDVAFATARVVRCVFGHYAVNAAIRIHVIEEYECAAMALAGLDGVAHHRWPLFLPDARVVFEARDEIGDRAPRDRVGRGFRVEEICADEIVCGMHPLRCPTDLSNPIRVGVECAGQRSPDDAVRARMVRIL
jgi:hypothetical protein